MLLAPIIGAFFVPTSQFATKLIIDHLTQNQQFTISDLIFPITLFISAQILLEISWRLANFAEYKSIPQIRSNIISNLYQKLQNHNFRFFQDNLSGTIAAKVSDITNSGNQIFNNFRFGVIGTTFSVFISLIFLYFTAPILSFAVLIFLFVFFPGVYFIAKRINPLSANFASKRQKVSGFIVDSISNITSVLLFANKNQEHNLISDNLNKMVTAEKKMLKFEFILHIFVGITYIAISLVILFLMIELRREQKVTIGDFALVLGILFHMLEMSFILILNSKELIRETGVLKASFNFFNEKYQIKNKGKIKSFTLKNPTIEFKNLSFAYDDDKIFDKLNLKIKSGEKVGIVGNSGAGKSSLVNLLLRYFDLEKGKILISGKDIAKINHDELRKNIAVIPQDTALFHRSLSQNIAYGNPQSAEKEIITASKKAHIHEFILTLKDGYNTLVGERGIKLSGGQRQRIAIARAILKDAPILILDEATSALDSQTEKQIQESLNLLIEDKNKTVIAIAHRLSTLKHMDRIIVLDQGKIVEEGTHNSLIKKKNSLYQKLWALQKI